MHQFRKTLVFVTAFFLLTFSIFPAMAQIDPVNGGDFGLPGSGGDAAAEAENIILRGINIFLGLIGVIALAILIWGGVQYITSIGDEGKAETAKKTILYAIVGLIVIGLAAVVVNFVIGAIQGS